LVSIDRVFGTETKLYEAMYNYIKVENVTNFNPWGTPTKSATIYTDSFWTGASYTLTSTVYWKPPIRDFYKTVEVSVFPISEETGEKTGNCRRSTRVPTQCDCNKGYDKNEQGRS